MSKTMNQQNQPNQPDLSDAEFLFAPMHRLDAACHNAVLDPLVEADSTVAAAGHPGQFEPNVELAGYELSVAIGMFQLLDADPLDHWKNATMPRQIVYPALRGGIRMLSQAVGSLQLLGDDVAEVDVDLYQFSRVTDLLDIRFDAAAAQRILALTIPHLQRTNPDVSQQATYQQFYQLFLSALNKFDQALEENQSLIAAVARTRWCENTVGCLRVSAFEDLPWWLDQTKLQQLNENALTDEQLFWRDVQVRIGPAMELVQLSPKPELGRKGGESTTSDVTPAMAMAADNSEAQQLPVIVKWTRPLEVAPTRQAQEQLRDDHIIVELCVENQIEISTMEDLFDANPVILRLTIEREQRREESLKALAELERWRIRIGTFSVDVDIARITGASALGSVDVIGENLRRGFFEGNWCGVFARRLG